MIVSDAARGAVRYLLRVAVIVAAALAPAYGVTNYTISLVSPAQHLVEVQIQLPEGSSQRELQLPVWNALYQVRDFAQYVSWIRAKDRGGRPLTVRALDKSRWQISGAEGGAVVEYQIYVDSFGPFGAQLTPHHAFFNLAQILMYPVELRSDPMVVHFHAASRGMAHCHVTDCLRRTVDSAPRVMTVLSIRQSRWEGFKNQISTRTADIIRVVVDAEPGDYDVEKIDAMLHKIVAAATSWMADRPFDIYMFLYHFPRGPAGGGMEHSYSTAIDVNADVLSRSPEVLASVTTHEFFHLWNVKRIRPQTLEPIDYTKENYTRALWFSEGCTSTAADIIQLRSGLLDESQFERQLSSGIAELERRPAHLTQSAEDSSLDAWLEGYAYYRHSDRSISYYNKGELLGIMLDLTYAKPATDRLLCAKSFNG
jgi:predicted metalloprotease with PDZ domain